MSNYPYRRTLATTPFLVPHGTHENNENNEKTTPTTSILKSLHDPTCGHIFLHALTWMRPFLFPAETADQNEHEPPTNEHEQQSTSSPTENPLSGRLSCPNAACGAHIGKFSWPGLKCSCGKWEVPAMALVKGRIDIIDRSRVGNLNPAAMGIRLPPGMRMKGDSVGVRGDNGGNL